MGYLDFLELLGFGSFWDLESFRIRDLVGFGICENLRFGIMRYWDVWGYWRFGNSELWGLLLFGVLILYDLGN